MKVRYDGPEDMFTYNGPSGTSYVFVGKLYTEVTNKTDLQAFKTSGGFTVLEDNILETNKTDLQAFKTSGGFTVLEDNILADVKDDGIKEPAQKNETRKKRITKKEDEG